MKKRISIGQYLIHRLVQHDVGHMFGIPGDYILKFYDLLEHSPIRTVVTTREDSAGFAADAYARVRGIGAVCVTYCVGGFNVSNPVAGAFAEKSPVIVVSGSPGMKERVHNPLLHHKVRDFNTQKEVFDKLTIDSAVLDDPRTAGAEIDRVLDSATRHKRPVYIEIPRDMIDVPIPAPGRLEIRRERSDPDSLKEAVSEAVRMINGAKRPVILADVELHRFGLQPLLVRLADKTRIPVAATLLGKSVISEKNPNYIGIYEGAMGREEVRLFVESSDCVIMLGTVLTDINLGIFTAKLDRGVCIEATSEKIAIRHHAFENVQFREFLLALLRAPLHRRPQHGHPNPTEGMNEYRIRPEAPITVNRCFQRLNAFLKDDMVVIADIGDALFGASDLVIHRRTEFLSPAYYTSMGFAVPAALGAQLANPHLRPLVLVGDGAFQMTGMELSTIQRLGLSPIVIVLNNHGYATERQIHDGPYNDITEWAYHRLPEIIPGGRGFKVKTEGAFDHALKAALANRRSFTLINVILDKFDRSIAMERIAKRLAKKV
ncbi:MAG: preprotein translocase subunit Tim44 [Candidatus Lindowbacteria bacterium RIFCSPLOWO2_12_FULL_62_27]|nr:MAG: preprotein translocase subunit Tim44 [Candidatus Lindowbacteria bacterium RIFCSPLOWO2_02_FULL_62_12]OGH57428.1 MAG: preprotein translocase subunit Tim44 [Candidatus Lindowbacteria bacterium RIFCSPLOWO2_12_FULL_62_27]